MRYFLIKLNLETNINVVRYIYPEWMSDTIKTKIINLSNTTPADNFVDVVIATEDENEVVTILENGGSEMSEAQFNAWKEVKMMILSLLEKEIENDEPTI